MDCLLPRVFVSLRVRGLRRLVNRCGSGGEAFALDQANNFTFGIDQFLGVIQLVGMRKRWDPRLLEGFMLARSDSQTYSFYSVG